MSACRRAFETNSLFIKKGAAITDTAASLPSNVVRTL